MNRRSKAFKRFSNREIKDKPGESRQAFLISGHPSAPNALAWGLLGLFREKNMPVGMGKWPVLLLIGNSSTERINEIM